MKKTIYVVISLFIFASATSQVPLHNIIQITQPEDSIYEPDSLGALVRVTGTVYGINVRTGGLEFTLHDATAGMEIFSESATFGYTVHEGDSLIVQGIVSFYNGVTELTTLDTIIVVGTGILAQPALVTALNESTEEELIRINNLTIPDTSEWSGTGNGFDCTATDGINNYTIFVYKLVDLYNRVPPTGTFDIIGIGSQFCLSSPYDTDYTITPRYHEDIIEHPTGIQKLNDNAFKIYPNPNNGQFAIELEKSMPAEIKLYDITGKIVYHAYENNEHVMVKVQNLNPGIYILELKSADGVYQSKINIQR